MHVYDQILKRKKKINNDGHNKCMYMIIFLRGRRKENNDGHMERYQAVRNGYEIKYDIKQG